MGLKLRNLLNEDLDKVFAYKTDAEASFKYKKVTICYRIIQGCILLYFLILAPFVSNSYTMYQMTTGINVVKTSAGGMSVVNTNQQGVWDALDVTYPNLEGNTIFVAVSSLNAYGQTRDTCSDPYRPCLTDNDCIVALKETCQAGYCNGPSWCNPPGFEPVTMTYDIPNHYLIWYSGEMDFFELGPNREYSTLTSTTSIEYPNSGANTYSISDLLNIGQVTYADVMNTGAILKVTNAWNCPISGQCIINLNVQRLDTFADGETLGSNTIKYYYYVQNGQEMRDIYNMTGITFVFDNKGVGTKFSFQMMILNFCAAAVFLAFSHYLIDYYLIWRDGAKFTHATQLNIGDFTMALEEEDEMIENQGDTNKETAENLAEEEAGEEGGKETLGSRDSDKSKKQGDGDDDEHEDGEALDKQF